MSKFMLTIKKGTRWSSTNSFVNKYPLNAKEQFENDFGGRMRYMHDNQHFVDAFE